MITDDSGPDRPGRRDGRRVHRDRRRRPPQTSCSRPRTSTRPSIARTARRHRLPCEASERFERGVDPQIAGRRRCSAAVDLLVELGGGTAADRRSPWSARRSPPRRSRSPPDLPGRVGRACRYAARPWSRRLQEVGCTVDGRATCWRSPRRRWRPDLTDPDDLVEEVVRLEGYDRIPSTLPTAAARARA